MYLADLIQALPERLVHGQGDRLEITGVAYDSRQVAPGDVFVCVRGLKADGHQFAAGAVQRGAVAVVVDHLLELPASVAQVMVPDTRLALALLGAAFYRYPSYELGMVGVTGTNGKTTTAHMIEAVLAGAGYRTGLIGTVLVKSGETVEAAQRTTPESLDLQRLLRQMADKGVQWVSMEVSSHALDLHRVAACEFDQAVFTNITRDHFDFHNDFANYLRAKAKLFTDLALTRHKPYPKTAVINADDPQAPALASRTRAKLVTYGLGPADVRAVDVDLMPTGSSFTVQSPAGVFRAELHLPGYFNVSNALAAITVGLNLGIVPSAITQALAGVTSIPGRYEVIDCGQDFTVIVDFAHNPDALANILRIPPGQEGGRRIAVFGAEGGKDRGKRPIMGQTAMRYADVVIVTSDNVYDEDPAEIASQVASGAVQAGTGAALEVIIDRREAIQRALELAQPGDLVVIAGKGHETYQVFNGWKRPFDDRIVVRELLEERTRT